MWSESPIRYPRRRTAVAGQPVTNLPDAARVSHVEAPGSDIGGGGTRRLTIPPLDGYTTALLITAGVGVSTPPAPAGWRVLGGGTVGVADGLYLPLVWQALCIDQVGGGESLTIDTTVGDNQMTQYAGLLAVFSGSAGGRWSLAEGPPVVGSPVVKWATPPAGVGPFVQACPHTMHNWMTDPPGYSSISTSFATVFGPTPGAYSGADYETRFMGAPVTGPDISYQTSTWQNPNTQAVAARWNP
jgi:hypothetical protein